jgi:single-strand DNA-binding protein
MMMNLAVVAGTLSSDPEIRTLPSGDRRATLQVSIRLGDAPATSVPVALVSPPAWVESVGTGDAVVVAGSVRRRFFRAAGATASRVEVEGRAVARGNDRRAVERVLRHARTTLDDV